MSIEMAKIDEQAGGGLGGGVGENLLG